MNSFVFSNGSNILLSVKTDLLDNQENHFTILEISGKTDETVALGLPNQQVFANIQEFKTLAQNASLTLKRFKSNGEVETIYED